MLSYPSKKNENKPKNQPKPTKQPNKTTLENAPREHDKMFRPFSEMVLRGYSQHLRIQRLSWNEWLSLNNNIVRREHR